MVDRGHKGERGQLAYAWNCHQPAARRRSSCHAHIRIDRSNRRYHGSPRRNQTPHGGRKTGDPLACLESLIDEGCGERARQPVPNTTARPRIWFSKATRWPTNFLRAMINERSA